MITKPESIIKLEQAIKKPLERLQHPHSWAKAQSYAIDDDGHIITLNLRGTGIQNLELDADFQYLRRLDLSKNQLSQVVFSSPMPDLELLDVSYNKAEWEKLVLPEGCEGLKYLYAYDAKLKNIEFKSEVSALEDIVLKENPLSSPPSEIVEEGLEAIKSYFEQINQAGKDYLFEAKIIIIGESGAGKTTFFRKLRDKNAEMPKEEETTKGIFVEPYTFPLTEGDIKACIKSEELTPQVLKKILAKGFRANLWDFGGQEIYHSTHQFFLTRSSLYILIADTREQKTDFNYWLSTVEQLSEDSPLLVVLNEKHGHIWRIDESGLKGSFPFFKEKFSLNLSDNKDFRPLENLRKAIHHHLTKLSHIGDVLPTTWTAIRNDIAKETDRYISLDRYFAICRTHNMSDTKKMLELSEYFHKIGVFLHYQDNKVLKHRIFLDANWTTKTVYKLLDDDTIINNKGRFTRQQAEKIWSANEHNLVIDELLSLLEQFSLVYHISDTPQYIAPEHLPEGKPYTHWDFKDDLLLFSYKFDKFMPKGLMSKLIVELHNFIPNHERVWLRGVVLKKGLAYAEIIETYGTNNLFDIRIAGNDKNELLAIIMYAFEKILSRYPKLKYDKHVPCNCEKCVDTSSFSDKHFYHYENLKKRLMDGVYDIQCDKSYKQVAIFPLLEDIGISSMKENVSVHGRVRDFLLDKKSNIDNTQPQKGTLLKIKSLIAKGRTEEALDTLETFLIDNNNHHLHNQLILISARYYEHLNKNRTGQDFSTEVLNQVNNSILGIIDEAMKI